MISSKRSLLQGNKVQAAVSINEKSLKKWEKEGG